MGRLLRLGHPFSTDLIHDLFRRWQPSLPLKLRPAISAQSQERSRGDTECFNLKVEARLLEFAS